MKTPIRRWAILGGLLVFAMPGLGLTGCGDEEVTPPPQPQPPGAVTVTVVTEANTVTVSWTAANGATSYRAELDDGTTKLTKTTDASTTEVVFGEADGIQDGTDYTATVFSINADGETSSANQPVVSVNFFPWDEFFPTSLHYTGQGKPTYYSASPNNGFERFTGIPYTELACQGCHLPDSPFPGPATGKTCDRCHDTATPQLGAQVDDPTVCLGCHGRQGAEVNLGYSDVHREAGMTCMDCHTKEDVMGDGTAYPTMLADGAIDANCENCHDPATHNTADNPHGDKLACVSCHSQSVITCNNCHFESEVNDHQKVFVTPPLPGGAPNSWLFLLNRKKGGKSEVYTGNFQSVKWDSSTFVAFGPYTSHTVTRSARSCTACHANFGGSIEATEEYNATGQVSVIQWDDVAKKVNHPMGVIPIPTDYLSALQFDFVDLDPGTGEWVFLKAGADTIQMLSDYAEPLSASQMSNLGMTGP